MLLVTGGSGLVGSTLKGDIKLSSKDLDLRDWDATYDLFKKFSPDTVIHCAARVGGVGANMKYKGEFFHSGVQMNLNVLEAASRVGVKKLVSFLSTCIYPDGISYPLNETQLHLGEPHSSNYPYAYAKRMLDVQSRAYREQYGNNFICVAPTNIYGPRDNYHLQDAHAMPALIHKCYLAKKNNTDFSVWGTGKSLREFIYSEDVGKLTEWALENYEEPEHIIFSTGEEISIADVAQLIAEAFDFRGNIVFDKTQPDGQLRKTSDISKLRSYLPDFRFTPIEEGIQKSVDWFCDNYEVARK